MYTSHKVEKQMAEAPIAAQTPAVKARVFPGLQKLVVRGIALVVTTQMTVTASVWHLKKRPTPGSATNEEVIAAVTVPTSAAIGSVLYKRGLNVSLQPGDELALELITASTAGAAVAVVEVDTTPETPANVGAEMILSA